MRILATITIVFGLMLCAGAARANAVKKLDRISASIDANTTTPEEQAEVLTTISSETGVPVETLKTQHAQTKLGYGELLIANSIASASGKTFAEIAALKASGQGWGEISKSYHIKLGPVVKQAHRTDKALAQEEKKEDKIKEEKIAKIKEAKTKKVKSGDDDFFNDHDNGAGNMKDADRGLGKDLDKGLADASHDSKSQGSAKGKGK